MVGDAAVEGGDHVLPVVVVGGHQHYATAGIIVGLEDFGVVEDITLVYLF